MRRVPIPLLAALALALTPGSARAALSYSPCAAGQGFSCASLPVPLQRGPGAQGVLTLGLERKLAGPTQSRDAVLALAGGPGQAMLPLGPYIAEAMAPAIAAGSASGRDLLLFDQRGTGVSAPLSCPALTSTAEASTAHSSTELIERCALQLGVARGAFTTQESVQDIEAVRQAGGYEKLVLYGTSYGTKVALEYAQRYPQHVESLVLDSTVAPEGPDPFHLSTFRSMRAVLAELCSHHACDGLGASPLGDLARLVEALAAKPLSQRIYDGRGHTVKITVTGRDLFQMLLAGDLNPAIRAALPAAVHSAVNRDPAPLARLLALVDLHPSSEAGSDINFTLFLDTSCEETRFPWQRSAPLATRAVEAEAALNALPSSDFYPFDAESGLVYQTIPLCVSWPDASPAPSSPGALPNVPTLILSGGQDLRTPTEDARSVAAMIPDAQLLTVPYTGHSVIGSDLSGCAKAALASFFAGTPVQGCGPGVNRFPPAPSAPRSLSAVRPIAGVGGLRGRTLTGVLDTLLDLRHAIVTVGLDFGKVPYGVRFGGLRGGTVVMTKAGAKLDRLSYLPGLQLTGLVPSGILLKNSGAAARLTIRGSAAAGGSIRLAAGGRLSGVLGGGSFHVSAAAKVRSARAGAAQVEWPGAEAALAQSPLARVP